MAIKDKIKWDKKYQEKRELLNLRPPSKLVELAASKLNGGRALDLACGSGRHTIYLREHNFLVDAVDISKIALDALSKRVDGGVNLIEADLDEFEIKANYYDLIVKTNFLDRGLIKRAKSGLREGGIFVVETYLEDKENEKKDSNPNFLLKKGELLEIFKDYEIIEYKEFWNEPYELYRMKKAGIAAKKL